MPTNAHEELCARMMVPGSARMARIWELIADETDAGLLLAMPGTVSELAGATGVDEKEIEGRAEELFRRGAVFKSRKPHGTVHRSPKHLIQFHDSSNQWPEAPEELFDLWKEFMHHEYQALLATMFSAGFPAFMRVVPGLEMLERLDEVEPFEDLRDMIARASDIAVCRCPCALVERNCDPSSVERCLQLGKGARYVLERGTGRSLPRDEALDLLRGMEERGLVHIVENKKGLGTVICNCCTCCCAIIKPFMSDPACRPILAASLYRATISPDLCTADGLCEDACPMGAARLTDGDEAAQVDADLCIGCGLCLAACSADAIRMEKIRTPDFVPD